MWVKFYAKTSGQKYFLKINKYKSVGRVSSPH